MILNAKSIDQSIKNFQAQAISHQIIDIARWLDLHVFEICYPIKFVFESFFIAFNMLSSIYINP